MDDLKQGDTLQILYRYFACFSQDLQLLEFNFLESDIKLRKFDWRGSWTPITLENPKSKLTDFITQGQQFHGGSGCSNTAHYTLRKKGSQTIYIIQEGACVWNGIALFSE